MKEIFRPEQKEIQVFKPEVGKLMIQDFYTYNERDELNVLSGSVLMFFKKIGEPGESWEVNSLARVVFNKSPDILFNSGLLEVRPDVASYYDKRTSSSIILDEDMSMIIYREVNDLSLNRFLYGMARYFKNNWVNSLMAKDGMSGWYNLLRDLDGLLPEEKEKIRRVYGRIIRSWGDVDLWQRVNNAGRKNISEF